MPTEGPRGRTPGWMKAVAAFVLLVLVPLAIFLLVSLSTMRPIPW
ncbi:hypothetical protein [Streptomyces justiciae]|nr:hypothetical protein [Streptomyces justiciae]MCW8384285.1 hypothetical protein [Streptomyces justiciae]